ncbi:MAG: U32 family peptidase [Pseudomonadota bacterium]
MKVDTLSERPKLVMGPVLFHWDAQVKLDFYARMADEADIDVVHVGEVVCSKRMPFFDKHLPDVIERLHRGGKQVVVSTLALVMGGREAEMIRDVTAMADDMPGVLIEANDMSAAGLLAGHPHSIGPFVNVYNEGTLRHFARRGAVRVGLPWELPMESVQILCAHRGAVEIEMQVFGRVPLAISARCYSARAQGLHKDGCRYVCGDHCDGMDVDTLDGEAFLAVNGLQTLSHSYLDLSGDIAALQQAGVGVFRLSPHSFDMVTIAGMYRQVIDGKITSEDLQDRLFDLCGDIDLANGFLHGKPGAIFDELPDRARGE